MRNVINSLSEFIRHISTDKTRQRQLFAVVCVFGLFIMLNVYSSEASSLEPSKEITEESITVLNKSAEASALPVSGITAEMGRIMQEAQETAETSIDIKISTVSESESQITEEEDLEPVRENTLYYVIDDNYTFYLDIEYQDYLWKKLSEYNHTELYELCLAQMYHESKFEPDTVSATNDHGLMQINAGNYSWLHNTLGISSLDDPYDSIDCGVYILVTNLEKYGSIEEALVAYNQGYCGDIKSTKYSKCILEHDLDCLHVLEEE